MKIKKLHPLCHEARFFYERSQKQDFLLISDVHFDHAKCDRKLLKRKLDEALRRNAFIICDGDFFCLMQGNYDRRKSKKALRPEYQTDRYLDTVIEDAVDFLAPYSKNLMLFGDGNHETSIKRYHETDVLARMCQLLRTQHGSEVVKAGYHGYIRMRFTHVGGNKTRSLLVYFHHTGSGGVVGKGSQGVIRDAAFIPQADIVITAHTHDSWIIKQPQMVLNKSGIPKKKIQYHVRPGTFKEEFLVEGGWAVEKKLPPRSLGGVWMTAHVQETEVKPLFSFAD